MRSLNIVLLDTNKLSETWNGALKSCLSQFGNLTFYVKTETYEIIDRCKHAEIVVVNKCKIQSEDLPHLTHVKYIIEVATGYDNIDVVTAKQLGIKVSNVPNYSTITVAQHTIALLLALANQIEKANDQIKNHNDWFEIQRPTLELSGLTLGLIGFGNIAKNVAKIAAALGMQIIVARNSLSQNEDLLVRYVNKEELFKKSDVISLHCALNSQTQQMINSNTLSLMKKTALLINTARGGLINEIDLYNALVKGQIQGAALDVFNIEPIALDNPLLTLDNCIITPHNASVSGVSRERWIDIISANIASYLNGNYINLV